MGRQGVFWHGRGRRELTIRVHLGPPVGRGRGRHNAIIITAILQRQTVPGLRRRRTLDPREFALCSAIAQTIGEFWPALLSGASKNIADATQLTFDTAVISQYIRSRYIYSPGPLLASLRRLSEESYEGHAITLGVIVDTSAPKTSLGRSLPLEQCLDDKKFKVVSDGYNTAYLIDLAGKLLRLLDLQSLAKDESPKGARYFPQWSRHMALSCTGSRIGFSLTRQGDVLYFENGTLRMTYRAGRWQFWNHGYVLQILRDLTRIQRASRATRTKILAGVYRQALDLSFKRSGGLVVLLRRRADLKKIVRKGDAISDSQRNSVYKVLDKWLRAQTVLGIPSRILVDLASVDGSIVLENSGKLRAWGAVLNPKRSRGITHGQGSRTKAALGASHYGLATKVSSDGDIVFYKDGTDVLSM